MEEGLVEAIQNYGGILHDGIHAETLKIHLPKASEVSSSLCNYHFSSFFYGV